MPKVSFTMKQGPLSTYTGLFAFILLTLCNAANAQMQSPMSTSISAMALTKHVGEQTLQPLKKGDPIPDLTFSMVYNYPNNTLKLSSYRGKLILLDFWSTWCLTCMDGFPKMDSLQKHFGDKIKIILVNARQTRDDTARINKIFRTRKKATQYDVKLPYIVGDSLLQVLFPHKSLPHYAWIDSNGKLLATTSMYEVNKKNIQAILDGEDVDLHQKLDIIDFNRLKPLFIDNNATPGNSMLTRSTITSYIEGLGFGSGVQADEKGQVIRAFYLNHYLRMLYKTAFELSAMPDNKLILETTKNSLLEVDADKKNILTSTFCYELLSAGCSEQDMLLYMRQDLERQFKVTVKKETRDLTHIVVSKNPQYKPGKKGKVTTVLNRIPLAQVLDRLNSISDKPIVYDGVPPVVDIVFTENYYVQGEDALKKALREAGFLLTDMVKPTNVFVFRDIQ